MSDSPTHLLVMEIPEKCPDVLRDFVVKVLKQFKLGRQEKGDSNRNLAEAYLIRAVYVMADSAQMINTDDLKAALHPRFDAILRKQLGFADTPADEFDAENAALAEAVVAVLKEWGGK